MRKYFVFLSIIFSTQLLGQSSDIIVKANQLGTDWKFEEAIVLLENGIKTNPKDSELYYWLGRYSHYLVYDTRPFENAGDKWSKEKVLNNLKKLWN